MSDRRFVLEACSKSLGGRIGAFSLLMGGGEIKDLHHIGSYSWVVMGYGVYTILASLIHQWRTWNRLEEKFNPDRADYAEAPTPD